MPVLVKRLLLVHVKLGVEARLMGMRERVNVTSQLDGTVNRRASR
jgi:hypothetical protein